MASSISSPATRMDSHAWMSASDMIATSVVPPPISTIMAAFGSSIGSPAPIPAAIGSSTKYTARAPARSAELYTARFSTAVIPDGIAMTTRGLKKLRLPMALRMKYDSIASVISKSAMTPSCSGRIALMDPGVLPSIVLATRPTALPLSRTRLVPFLTATTEGSFSTMPSPFTHTSVLHVPKSMPMSTLNMPRNESNITTSLSEMVRAHSTRVRSRLQVSMQRATHHHP